MPASDLGMTGLLFALAALFLWSFLAATVLPLSSEAPLVVYVRSYQQVSIPVLVATVGNYLGACTTYWLARRVSRRTITGGCTRAAVSRRCSTS